MNDLLQRLVQLDRHLAAMLQHLTAPTTGPAWHELDTAARSVRRRWLLRAMPPTMLATVLLTLLGTTVEASTAPLEDLGALVVAMLPLVVLAAAYRRRFEQG